MAGLLVLYRNTPDPEAFERHYRAVHLPLVRQLPGLRRLEAWRVTGTPYGPEEYQAAALIAFDPRQSVVEALRSPAGRASGEDLVGFAREGFKMLYLGERLTPGRGPGEEDRR